MKRLNLIIALLSLSFNSLAAEGLSLDDLGFNASDVKVDKALTEKLEKRNWMLKAHQYTALGALALMSGAILTAGEHKQAKDSHVALGIAGATAYYTAASFAFLAPELDEKTPERGMTVWHRRLAWIHFPALLIGPTLGYLANQKYKKGQEPTGMLKNHAAITTIGFIAFAASALTMTIEF